MSEGPWRCGMCAAHNEPSKHTCMVCDTVRGVGTRGESGEGDLLAPAENTAFSPEQVPPIRVMEPPRPTDPSGVFAPVGVRPGGDGPEAADTERHRIVLCSNSVGELFYFGEFLDGDGEAMVVPAERTDEGYAAESGQTRYEVVGDEAVITGSDGREMARLVLETVENPR